MASYVIQSETLEAMADEVRILADTPDKMSPDDMTANVAQANTDIETQTDLIAQIRTALDGKAGASGSEVIAEIASLIDESGVLEGSEGTVKDKVGALIDRADLFAYVTRFAISDKYEKESIDWYIDFPYVMQINEFLRNNKYVKRMVGINTAKCTTLFQAFMGSVIEEIERPFNFSSITGGSLLTNAFQNAYNLREVRFDSGTIKYSMVFSSAVLSTESIQSIIDGLATVETAQTLTLHKDIKAKLTDDQLATITSKNWNLA